jgi:hypothetical protein
MNHIHLMALPQVKPTISMLSSLQMPPTVPTAWTLLRTNPARLRTQIWSLRVLTNGKTVFAHAVPSLRHALRAFFALVFFMGEPRTASLRNLQRTIRQICWVTALPTDTASLWVYHADYGGSFQCYSGLVSDAHTRLPAALAAICSGDAAAVAVLLCKTRER